MSAMAIGQQNHLDKKVSLSIPNWQLGKVLKAIESQAGFYFSYDAEIVPEDSIVTIKVEQEKVGDVLERLLPRKINFKAVGNHVVIFKSYRGPEEVVISGYIRDGRSNKPLAYATLYDAQRNQVATSNASGYYEMTVANNDKKLGLTVSKSGYRQEVIYIQTKPQGQFDFELLNLQKPIDNIEAKKLDYPDVNDRKLVQFMVPDRVVESSNNLTLFERMPFQLSFVPGLSTNGLLNGSSVNNFSVNVLAGYSKGTDGIELGGLVNINREDMTGLQMAGIANYAGRFMKGVQAAGMLNYSGLKFDGLQMAGMGNLSLGDMDGVQMSGFSNILRGKMDGFQITGFTNFTSESLDGVQIAGFLNITAKEVNFAQISGFGNYSQRMGGLQLAGFINFASEEVNTAQISGFMNYAPVSKGLQLSGYTNIAIRENRGLQLTSFFNYARNNNGVQLAMFNYADSSSGVPLGFLSIVRYGYHTLELSTTETFPVNISYKTGVDRFYNIFELGVGENDLVGSYGFGTMPFHGRKINLNIDLTAGGVVAHDGSEIEDYRLLFRFTPSLNYQPFKRIGIAIGPSLNYYIAGIPAEGVVAPLARYAFYQSTTNGFFEQAWIGGRLALRFF